MLSAVQSLSRRIQSTENKAQTQLDRLRFQIKGPKAIIGLTAAEADLVVTFAMARERFLERWQVAEKFGLADEDINRASMEVRFSKLRQKMLSAGIAAPVIKSIRNNGYSLCCDIEII